MQCFLCHPLPQDLSKEGPGNWCEPRILCPLHEQKEDWVLPTGEPLATFYERMDKETWPPEGEPFSFIINPVFIAGRRCWMTFKFGGCAIWEEIYSSANFFEWLLLHRGADRFYRVFSDVKGPDIVQVRNLFSDWMWHNAVELELAKRNITFPRSVEESYDILDSLQSSLDRNSEPQAENDAIFLREYQKLAAVRFAHLQINSWA